MVLVGIFFVSGADAASIVMGTLSQKGSLEPSRWAVVFWGVVTGAVAAIMLLVGSGQGDALTGLQNLTILAAAPFVVVMIFMCVALMRDLRHDPLVVRDKMGSEAVELAVIEGHKSTTASSSCASAPAADRTWRATPSASTDPRGACRDTGRAPGARPAPHAAASRAACRAHPQATVTPAPPWP
ncbi:hypothetical protein STENM223S_02798 [Streptomyces tendae]